MIMSWAKAASDQGALAPPRGKEFSFGPQPKSHSAAAPVGDRYIEALGKEAKA